MNDIQPVAVLNFNKLWKGTNLTYNKNELNYRIIRCIPMKLKGVWTLGIEYEPLYDCELRNFVREWEDIYNNYEFEEGPQVKEAFKMMCLTCLRKIG